MILSIHKARLIKSWILMLCIVPLSNATSIVISHNSSEVIIGSDSKGSFGNGEKDSFKNVCKIYQKGSVIFAIAGLANNPITGFNSYLLIDQEIKGIIKFDALVKKLERSILSSLEQELAWQRIERPDLYKRTLGESNLPLSFVVAGTQDGAPVFYMRGFTATGEILKEDHTSSLNPLFMGKANAIQRFYSKQLTGLTFKTPEETVRSLIQLEIDDLDDSRSVGGPIDIVRITSKGPSWVQRKPECAR